MANTIILKKSAVSAKVPTSGDLAQGELAINTADSKIYLLNPAGDAVIDYTATKLDATDGSATNLVTAGQYETIATVTTDIDVSASNVQTGTISADTTFTFSGWTTDASAVVFELTTSNTPVITFTGVTWAFGTAPTTSAFMRMVFTSTDNGTTIRGSIIEDGS